MTDAEFMLEYVARKHTLYANFREIEKDEPPCVDLAQEDKEKLAELDALEALAKLHCYLCKNNINGESWPGVDCVCCKDKREALRKFRERMEGK